MEEIGHLLLPWYDRFHRELPWRGVQDPYAIWVSETMLQQTRVETVRSYFPRFMARFPSLAALAQAPLEDVLKCWEGLGYYRRAQNLHRGAQQVMDAYGGRLPADPAALRRITGIGPYTAGPCQHCFRHSLPRGGRQCYPRGKPSSRYPGGRGGSLRGPADCRNCRILDTAPAPRRL